MILKGLTNLWLKCMIFAMLAKAKQPDIDVIPSALTVERIDAGLPSFSADVSTFVNSTPEEIADWVSQQERGAVLNVTNAEPFERERFESANAILAENGHLEIVLYDNEQEVSEICREITDSVVTHAREAFKVFIMRIVNNPDNFIDEYNEFVADRGKGLKNVHYWRNLGLEDMEDELRNEVIDMIDEVLKEVDSILGIKVVPYINENPAISDVRDAMRVMMIGMVSNMVRGVMYNYTKTSTVRGLRKEAVDTLRSFGQLYEREDSTT